MDVFRRQLDSYGPGGIKCRCCRPTEKKGRKCRHWNRKVRQVIKQTDRREIAKELSKDE